MNWSTFIIWKPDFFTFRVLGFGVFIYALDSDVACLASRALFTVPILPGVRFAFVAPWI